MSSSEPIVHPIFEPQTSTWQYIVADPSTKSAIIIDSVLDFNPATNTLSTTTADALLSLAAQHEYSIVRILDTHVHADHLTASHYLQHRISQSTGAKPPVCIGQRIAGVQQRFAKRYGIPSSEITDVFDHLLGDDEVFSIGDLSAKAIHLPGHTPDHMGYKIGANVFCGDSLFNTDVGSARCDFPDGNAHDLYNSVKKLFSFPDDVKIWTGHDYPPGTEAGRDEPLAYTTVGDQKARNKHLKTGTTEEEFVTWRQGRDKGLSEPRLLHQSLQFNIRAGRLPAITEAGDRLLHVPLKITGELAKM
ncbi:hypothetical protein OQA88_13066 [Cercophora sp. LCS_1]